MAMNHKYLKPRLAGGYTPSDADAKAYIAAVESADGQKLEKDYKVAVNDFVAGCKADGIWDAMKVSCILMGARTLSGALTPLVGSAPTNNGPFVSGDYVRGGATPGLKGNGSTKYINTGRADNADGQDDAHRAVYCTSLPTANFMQYIGARKTDFSSMTEIYPYRFSGFIETYRHRTGGGVSIGAYDLTEVVGFKGHSRSAAATFSIRSVGQSFTKSDTSAAPGTNTTQVFAIGGSTGNRSDARIAFYSAGSALTLTSLESRVAALITAVSGLT